MSSALDSLIPGRDLLVLKREASAYVSSSFHEILTCRFSDGSIRKLLLKRGVTHAESSHGNHGGVPYEAEIYRLVLEPLDIRNPRLHAAFVDAASGETVILIDYIDASVRLSKAEASKLYDAARWIAAFHKANQNRVELLTGSVQCYGPDYYSGWMRRAVEFWSEQSPWLGALQDAWNDLARELQCDLTIVHGEYYPKNILVSGDTIIPIDWETTAIAAGEIDVVFLTERWPDQIREACESAYGQARWPEGAPPSFHRRLLLANMYSQLLRLGHKKHLVSEKEAVQRLNILHNLCRKAGLVA